MHGTERIFLIKSALSAIDTANNGKFRSSKTSLPDSVFHSAGSSATCLSGQRVSCLPTWIKTLMRLSEVVALKRRFCLLDGKRSGVVQEHPIYFTFVVIDDMVPLLSLSGRAWDVYCRCRWDKRYGQVVERRL